MNKVIYATVMYDCHDFSIFMNDYLESVFIQTEQNFELLILNDNANQTLIERDVKKFNLNDKNVHILATAGSLSPIQLRKKLISVCYELNADILIFSDFDETVADNRVEEVVRNIGRSDFIFNDFYVVDRKLKRIENSSFFDKRTIPNVIQSWHAIGEFNFVGLGSLAINLSTYSYDKIDFPEHIVALDWYIATRVLLDQGTGVKLASTYANYRQHDNSLIGFDFYLDKEKLSQGIKVKKNHYYAFNEHVDFQMLYFEILALESYIAKTGIDNYISAVNSKFDTSKFCWWENIKLVKEIDSDTKRIK